MPVLQRIDWLSSQLAGHGRAMHIAVGPAKASGLLKFRIVLHSANEQLAPGFVRQNLLQQLHSIRDLAVENVAVDRGHKFSAGHSEVGIWIRPRMASGRAEAASKPGTHDHSLGGDQTKTCEGVRGVPLESDEAHALAAEPAAAEPPPLVPGCNRDPLEVEPPPEGGSSEPSNALPPEASAHERNRIVFCASCRRAMVAGTPHVCQVKYTEDEMELQRDIIHDLRQRGREPAELLDRIQEVVLKERQLT
mmetsp:Transcript_48358/g.96139  ORF Transcript_48358/g.96139 Transcript_48358/m.96139 type:complete len:249 (-) Transcript_48358:108-854(-)